MSLTLRELDRMQLCIFRNCVIAYKVEPIMMYLIWPYSGYDHFAQLTEYLIADIF